MSTLSGVRLSLTIIFGGALLCACGGSDASRPTPAPAARLELEKQGPKPRKPVELPPAFAGRVEHEGVMVDVAISPLGPGRTQLTAFEGARVRFTIRDTAGNAPLSGVYPAGWMHPRSPDAPPPDARGCAKLIEGFVSGSIFNQPEVDLNTFMVLVLNGDATISVVDPRFGFGGSKLLTMIPLGGPGYDWVLSEDDGELYVSVPDAGEIAVIETHGYDVVAQVHVGEAAGRVLLAHDEQYLWTAGSGGTGELRLAAIDVEARSVVARLELGAGEHDLAISDDDRFLFVSDATANTVTVVDTRTLSVHGVVQTGWEPVSLDYSSAASALFVSERGEGRISIIDPLAGIGPSIVGHMQAEAGIEQLRFAPGDRFGLVVNPRQDLLHVFDAASRRILRTGQVAPRPDEVAFSSELAYVRHGGSDTVYMLHLDELDAEGTPLQIVDFPAGQNHMGPRSSPAASMVKAPGENAMLVAHPVDRAIYYYKEGMAAPMGQFSNYRQQARAVLTVDRSFEELETRGVYETSAMLGPPGMYDLAIFMDSPRVVHCFSVEVAENPEREREIGPPVRVEWDLPDAPIKVGEPVELVVRLFARRTDEPLLERTDVTISLGLLTRENFQAKLRAEHRGGGEYRVSFTPTLPGPYQLRVTTRDLAFEESVPVRMVALAGG